MRRVLLILMLCGVHNMLNAQGKVFYEHPGPKVLEGAREKTLAWAGGINAPQFAQGDLNNDGIQDLVVFEPEHRVRTYIGNGSAFQYNPDYQYNFPDISKYIKLIDYNRDNVPDLIHRGSVGYSIYKGYYDAGGKLAFVFYKDLYYHLAGSGDINAYCEPMDIPGVADVDNDGDIDFLSFDISGGYINFYRNCQVENQLPKDSIVICLKDNCWGKTFQGIWRTQYFGKACNQFGVSCKGCPQDDNGRTTHSGNTLCLYDYDRDGDIDYFTGNVLYPELQYVKNGRIEHGYGIDTMVAQDTIWGSNGRDVNINTWPATFLIDADNDADTDFVFSPHSQTAENYKSAVLYKNTGTISSPSYTFDTDSFLVADMIDVGSGSYPVFYDYNKDSKLDILIGTDGYYNAATGFKTGGITYLENTGSASQPQFTLRTRDLAGIAAAAYRGTALAIGDLDGDGKDDLVLGHTDGSLSFYTNTAASNAVQPVWTLSQQELKDKDGVAISVGGFAAPCIYDIDKDGKPDLLIGCQAGYVFYYRNDNTGAGLSLQYGTNMLGAMKAGSPNHEGYSTPYVGRIDDTGKEYIMLGSLNGELYRYDGFQNGNTTNAYTRLDSFYSQLRVTRRVAPAFADLFSDNKYELLLGSSLGGVHYMMQYFFVGVEEAAGLGDGMLTIYPNPAKDQVVIDWRKTMSPAPVDLKIVSATGQVLLAKELNGAEGIAYIDVPLLPVGMYYCIITQAGQRMTKPLAIVR